MTFKQIECFLTVAKTLNFTQASEELFMSQPTVSRHIKHLEDYLGLTLFFRNTNTVHLTPAGLLMLQTFKETLDFIDNQKKIATEMTLGEQGHIEIGFLNKMDIIHYFSERLNIFQKLYPNIELHYLFLNYEELKEKLLKKELDVAFLPDFTAFDPKDVFTEAIWKTNAFLVYGKNHPLADKENISFLDFKNDVFISAFPKEVTNRLWEKIFSYYGIAVWKTSFTNSFDAGMLKIFMGEAVTILDPVAGQLDDNLYKILPIPNEISAVNISVTWLRSNYNTSLPLLLNILTDLDYGIKLLKKE